MQPPSYSRRDMPTIQAFARSDAFIRGLMGPFGSGKSSACVWEVPLRGVKQRPGPDGVRRSRWVVVRNTFPQLKDTTIRTFHQWFPPQVFGQWKATDHDYIMRNVTADPNEPPAEIEVLFRALDRPEHVSNLLSLELTGGWVNEAREVPWAIIEAIQGRVGRYPAMRDGGPTWSGIWMDTNPPDEDSEWYRFFESADHTEAVANLAQVIPGLTVDTYAKCFKQPSGLAPNAENKANLTPGYYERLCVGKKPEWIKVYVKGEYGFVMDGKPVFPEYSDTFHCRECQTIPDVPVYRGWDWGLTPACVFMQMQPSGRFVVVDELVATSMGADRFSDRVLEHSARFFPDTEFVDIGDPAGAHKAQTDERTCFEICWAKGILIEPGMQTPAMREESVRKPLRTVLGVSDDGQPMPQFSLHPRCKMVRKGMMGGYHYRRMQVSGEKYADKPEKNAWSHPCEALCYGASRIFGPVLRTPPRDDEADFERMSRLVMDRTRSLVTGY